jgi:hypothetical protein
MFTVYRDSGGLLAGDRGERDLLAHHVMRGAGGDMAVRYSSMTTRLNEYGSAARLVTALLR